MYGRRIGKFCSRMTLMFIMLVMMLLYEFVCVCCVCLCISRRRSSDVCLGKPTNDRRLVVAQANSTNEQTRVQRFSKCDPGHTLVCSESLCSHTCSEQLSNSSHSISYQHKHIGDNEMWDKNATNFSIKRIEL